MTVTITGISAFAVLFLLSVIYLVKNPEKADQWNNIITRLNFWNKERRERKLISTSLDYRITAAAKQINKEADGILPFGLRIKWKSPEEATAYVQNNEVIVVLRKSDDLDKNIVDACMAYVPKALIPKARNTIDATLLDSMDLYLTSRILSQGNYSSAYNYFSKNILDELRTNSTAFNSLFEAVGSLDSVGLYTRVLLEEFKRLGDQLYGTLEESQYKAETVDFLKFLARIATRQPGDDTTPLFFSGRKIRIGIVLFAKRDTLTISGVEAYVRRIYSDYKKGSQRIFLFSYAQKTDEIQYDHDGFVVGVRKMADFRSLDLMEQKCRELMYLRLLKKEVYYPKDSTGKSRTAKYYAYECIP
jgi:hypothetical protein